jgi:hypothetical protein
MKRDKIFVVAALLASGVARAASLENAEGDVRVNQGPGFAAVQSSAELAAGDKIKVGRKGAARLVYDDKCAVKLPAGSLTTVARHSPCSFIAQDLPYTKGEPYVPLAEAGDPWWLGAGAAALFGGGVAGALASTSSNGSSPPFFPIIPSVSP